MRKILIAIDNDFIRETYSEVFKEDNFEVFMVKKGKEAIDLAKKELPDIIIADTELSEMGGLKLIEALKEEASTEKIPVIIFSQIEKQKDRAKAMELEAKDFITAVIVTPIEVVRRVKIALGEQKSYRIFPQKNLYNAKELITDLGYTYDFKCSGCGNDLVFYLIRDLSKGEKYFILSVICPECGK
ncbi:unnamed protein product [marine sediment metagenome]|uniref:Response regulatory domain-containing protein n=1 Tax=marine sediment metagenome TaxID=412755 RepID=X0UDX7_9ZZZZ